MKINRIYIAAFGGLKNKTIDFKDGFSVIYGENENGKTTIMTFIKMMFYGSERGSSSIAKNPRKKYAPWSGEKSAGSIDFEHGGRSYRLEREFGNTNSSDKITLTDMSDGTRESLSGNVGERFFGTVRQGGERFRCRKRDKFKAFEYGDYGGRIGILRRGERQAAKGKVCPSFQKRQSGRVR